MSSEVGKVNLLCIVPSLRRGGAETQVVDLVDGLDGGAFKKIVVTFEPGLDQLARLEETGAGFHHFLRKRKIDLGVARNIAAVIDEQNIDIVHCTLQIALLMGWFALRFSKRKPKLVVTVHTTLQRSLKDKILDRIVYRRLLYSCDRVIFVCRTQADHWMSIHRRLRNKSVVIYNGVDHEYYDPDLYIEQGAEFRAQHGMPEDARLIACIAGFRVEKGHDYLINAFSQLDPGPYLILAGDGVQRKAIEQLIRDSGVSDRILLLGEIQDVKPLLAAADVTVIASTAVETFSIAMLESMAMGVPVVATNVGGLGEAVHTGRTGELVTPGSSDELYQALKKVVLDDNYRCSMFRQARSDVIKLFSKEAMISQTRKVLLDLVAA